MIQSAEEAREIVTSKNPYLIGSQNFLRREEIVLQAKGYLAGMEDPAVKALVEALEYANRELTRHKFYKAQDRLLSSVCDALSQYRQATTPERRTSDE